MENTSTTPVTNEDSADFVFAPSFPQHHHHQPLVPYYTQRVFACATASTTIMFHAHSPFCNPTTLPLSLYLHSFHLLTRNTVFLYAILSNLQNLTKLPPSCFNCPNHTSLLINQKEKIIQISSDYFWIAGVYKKLFSFSFSLIA